MKTFLEFEKPIAEIEGKIEELRHITDAGELNIADEVTRLQAKVDKLLRDTYRGLTPAQKVQVARHPNRPHALDYIQGLITDFQPLAGDRAFGEDRAIVGGLGRFQGRSVVVIGQEKGNDTESRLRHSFGMSKPEGYRKAQRLLDLADRFHLPVITIVDTAGAYPGVASEERGVAEAIAKSIESCLRVQVPVVSVVIGEGGSGGAIGIAVADRVLMLEHAIYSVITPEGCASILWRSASHSQEAAAALKLTAQDLKQLGVIDGVIEEPVGGAHRFPQDAIRAVGDAIGAALAPLGDLDGKTLRNRRREKFLAIGQNLG
ncbi:MULTISPECIES: acetyl-CoA carboxylase carboxyltransferase subunit alpha [Inquilinus]|jgi:acetyl-CoA carboxylase carboxyl transferase subunit alpha|uniref:Acetyl-coenzyme A carboxylase carboxyl transferase subunit alpha n=1 Tax=Inquilinus ginsengisoli TaxID=363840 RepID=A0ABU1K0Q0_9PROT|nr:acetyl-CoA carboxylase carboxyltransferase subunit alpha [Inquilinus ginsengisoli]MDR6294442.1 acetyl-CoA carboxylase carboxyl transferase subunit alpha [Inquilinus ginsengisoli]